MKAWVRVDADIFGHPKFAGMSPATFAAWVKALCHCRQFRTDGTIAANVVPTIANKRARAELVKRKLWHERADGGVDVHDYAEYQLTEADWKAYSAAGKKAADARWSEKRDANRIRTASESNATPMPTDFDSDSEKKTLGGAPRRKSDDDLWNTMGELFGHVAPGTGKRNKAVGDLRKMGATPDDVRAVFRFYPKFFRDAALTDMALATHYPQLHHELNKPPAPPACAGCGVGGGHHADDCPRVLEAQEASSSNGHGDPHAIAEPVEGEGA